MVEEGYSPEPSPWNGWITEGSGSSPEAIEDHQLSAGRELVELHERWIRPYLEKFQMPHAVTPMDLAALDTAIEALAYRTQFSEDFTTEEFDRVFLYCTNLVREIVVACFTPRYRA